jgi:hypothetical protein
MLRALFIVFICASILCLAATDPVWVPTPFVKSVAPSPAKVGDELVAIGQNLGKEFVAAVFLTRGDSQTQANLVAQTDNSLKFKVPAGLKAGRFGIMILTCGDTPRYIDEPVYVVIQ